MIEHIRGAEQRYEDGPYTYELPVPLFCDDRCCSGEMFSIDHTDEFVFSVCFRGGKPKLQSKGIASGA